MRQVALALMVMLDKTPLIQASVIAKYLLVCTSISYRCEISILDYYLSILLCTCILYMYTYVLKATHTCTYTYIHSWAIRSSSRVLICARCTSPSPRDNYTVGNFKLFIHSSGRHHDYYPSSARVDGEPAARYTEDGDVS